MSNLTVLSCRDTFTKRVERNDTPPMPSVKPGKRLVKKTREKTGSDGFTCTRFERNSAIDFEEYFEEEDSPQEEMKKSEPAPRSQPTPTKKGTAKKQGSIMSFFSKK